MEFDAQNSRLERAKCGDTQRNRRRRMRLMPRGRLGMVPQLPDEPRWVRNGPKLKETPVNERNVSDSLLLSKYLRIPI